MTTVTNNNLCSIKNTKIPHRNNIISHIFRLSQPLYSSHRLPRVANGPLYNTSTPFGCSPSYRQYNYNATPTINSNYNTIPLNTTLESTNTNHLMQTSFVERQPELLQSNTTNTSDSTQTIINDQNCFGGIIRSGGGGGAGGAIENSTSNSNNNRIFGDGNNTGNETVIDEGRIFQVSQI